MSNVEMTQSALEAACDAAMLKGFTVIEDNDYTLLLDLDNPEALAVFNINLTILQQHLEVVVHDRWPSKSSTKIYPHEHVVLKLGNPLTQVRRFALQAFLGSDPRRELLNCLGFCFWGVVGGNVLFKPAPVPETSDDDIPF